AAGQAYGLRLTGVTNDTIAKVSVFRINCTFTDSNAATLKVRSAFSVFDTAEREFMRAETDATGATVKLANQTATFSYDGSAILPLTDTASAAVSAGLFLRHHLSSGTPAAGMGYEARFQLDS